MNLSAITATRPRALLIGAAVGLLLGLGAMWGIVAAADAANPGRETEPASGAEKGGLPYLPATRPAAVAGVRAIL